MDNENIFKSQYTSEQIEQAIGNALNGVGGSQLYRHMIRFKNADFSTTSNIQCQFVCSIAEPLTTENAVEFVRRICGVSEDYNGYQIFMCQGKDQTDIFSIGLIYSMWLATGYKTSYATFTTRLQYTILKNTNSVLTLGKYDLELETDTSYTDTVTPL